MYFEKWTRGEPNSQIHFTSTNCILLGLAKSDSIQIVHSDQVPTICCLCQVFKCMCHNEFVCSTGMSHGKNVISWMSFILNIMQKTCLFMLISLVFSVLALLCHYLWYLKYYRPRCSICGCKIDVFWAFYKPWCFA